MDSSFWSLIEPGDLLVAGQTLGEPTALIDLLLGSGPRPSGLRLFGGMSLTGIFTKAPRDVSLSTFVGLGRNADLIEAGRMDLIPCHMSDLPAEAVLAAASSLIGEIASEQLHARRL